MSTYSADSDGSTDAHVRHIMQRDRSPLLARPPPPMSDYVTVVPKRSRSRLRRSASPLVVRDRIRITNSDQSHSRPTYFVREQGGEERREQAMHLREELRLQRQLREQERLQSRENGGREMIDFYRREREFELRRAELIQQELERIRLHHITTITRQEQHKYKKIDLRATHRDSDREGWRGVPRDVFDVHRERDLTFHLELPIHIDHSNETEDLSRLRRLGDFAEGKDLIQEHFLDHMNRPIVLVQYAELLFDMADYKALQLLDPKPAFGSGFSLRPMASRLRQLEDGRTRFVYEQTHTHLQRRKRGRYARNSDREELPDPKLKGDEDGIPPDLHSLGSHGTRILHLNWRLLESLCAFHAKGTISEALADAKQALHAVVVHKEISSAEVRGQTLRVSSN